MIIHTGYNFFAMSSLPQGEMKYISVIINLAVAFFAQ